MAKKIAKKYMLEFNEAIVNCEELRAKEKLTPGDRRCITTMCRDWLEYIHENLPENPTTALKKLDSYAAVKVLKKINPRSYRQLKNWVKKYRGEASNG